MATPLKYLYDEQFFNRFCKMVELSYANFDSNAFMKAVYGGDWEALELKQRMRHIAVQLHRSLPSDYKEAMAIILQLVAYAKKQHKGKALEYMFLPDFVEQYGMEEVDLSIKAMEEITSLTSCEFAVRPFIIRDKSLMMRQMLAWSKSRDHHIRRLASEGCRPRLPWSMALPALKQDPTDILPILEQLKDDPTVYVRKSVANNLNDISKDNPSLVIDIAKRWIGPSANTDWVVKHACRTLLKQGNQEVMQLFGFGSIKNIKIDNFEVLTPFVKIGEFMFFRFDLTNLSKSATKIRLEYGLYYQKANGTLSKKVFMIGERVYPVGEAITIQRRQSFKLISTRKFYTGLHRVALIVNGVEGAIGDFFLEGAAQL